MSNVNLLLQQELFKVIDVLGCCGLVVDILQPFEGLFKVWYGF